MAKATVLNTPPPAPVPTHPVVYVFSAALLASVAFCFKEEFLQPEFLAGNDNRFFFEHWFYIVIAILSTPHILYMYIWWAPNRFTELATKTTIGRIISGGRAPDLMHFFVRSIKLTQFATVILWRLHANGIDKYALVATDVYNVFNYTTPLRLGVGIFYGIVGQTLNFGVYNAIGKDGVNYGFKLGAPGPWVTCFPYNLGLRHAQYTGAVLSILGYYIAFATPESGLASLVQCLIWCSFYRYSSWMEASSDHDTSDDKLFTPSIDKSGELTVKGGIKKNI